MRKILLLILGLLVIPLQILLAQAPKIIGYQYWFDDNDAGMISQTVSPATTLDLSTSVNVPTFPVGFHRFNIRFQDDSLRYSQVSTSFFFYPESTLINGYEYWFNDDYAGKTVVSVSNTTLLDLSSAIAATGLNSGLNTFHIRFSDVTGTYSSTSTAYFVIIPEMHISGYEYWFDNDYGSKTAVNVANTQILDLSEVITATSLSLGFHDFHIRFKNNTGTWCSTQSDLFYKHGTSNQNNLTSYEYWFDDNPAAKVSVPVVNQPTADVMATINASALGPGLHKAHVRFQGSDISSVVSSSYFYKSATATIAENAISGYRFWFDNDPSNMRVIALSQPASNVILLDSVELPYLPLGKHLMNMDFRDTLGSYSSVVWDTIDVLNCHPYAAKPITGNTQICKGTNGVVYSTRAITNATGYSWTLPEGATIVSGNNTRTITVNYALNAMTGPITVSGTNPCGNGAEYSLLVTLNPLPEPVITPNGPTTICQGESVVLTASGGTGYLWSNGATTAPITLNSTGISSVTVTNIFGCTDTASQAVTVNPLPVPVITPGGPTTFCQGGSVVLTASGGTDYLWSNAATTAAITVTTSGDYTVTVTNSFGCKSTTSHVVTVHPLPIPVITPGGPTTFCQGGSVVLTASGGTGYQWSNAANTTAITVNASGTYGVTVTDANGCINSTSQLVTVNPLPVPTITPNGPTTFCQGGSVVLTASGGTGYQWSNAASTATITVNSSGTYGVTVTDANGCINNTSKLITVNPLPVSSITPNGPTTFCQGGSVVLTASGGTGYQWSNAASTAAITVITSGTYGVTVTDANGCMNNTSQLVTVNPLPVPTITPNGPTTFCQGGSVVLTASGGTGYQWSNAASTATITVNSSGTYGVTVTDANGCINNTSQLVTVNPLPVPTITPNGPTTFCQGGSVVLTASGGTGYQWSNAASTAAIIVNASGTYGVTVTNADGCINNTSMLVTVNLLPVATITPNGPTIFCQGGSVVLTASGGIGYQWSNAASTAAVSVNASGTYWVTVTDANGCNNTASQEVTVYSLPPSNRVLAGAIIPGGQTLCADATDTLIVPESGNSFQVETGGNAILIAGKTIKILPGTKAFQGGYLHGYISSDCFYCNAVPHTLPQAFKEETVAGISGEITPNIPTGGLLQVYPNPTTGIFTLESTNNTNLSGTVEIYEMRGERLLSRQLSGERKHEFSLQGQPNGIYIIRFVSEGASATVRIIKY